MLSNVCSLENKLDLIQLSRSTQHEARDCCVFVFTETWLNDNIPDSAIQLNRLTCCRSDRDTTLSGKSHICVLEWRELQCCWPQDPPADSEHGCKDHRCPSPIHPGHFPCTMLQQNQQHREGPHPPLPQSLSAPTIRKTVHQEARSARLLNSFFPQAVRALNSKHPPPPQPYLIKEKTVNFFCAIQVCYTQVSGPVQTTCSNTLSSMH